MAERVPTDHPEECVLYYCRTLAEIVQVEASVLGLKEPPAAKGMFGGYVAGKPFRAFGSADTGTGSAGWGLSFYGITRDWAKPPKWLQYGVARLFVPSSAKHEEGREVLDLPLLMAKRSLQQGDAFHLADLFAERIDGMRKVRIFSDEKTAVEMRADEICASAFVRWINARALLPSFYKGLRDGGDPEEVLEKLCGKPLDDIEKQMLAWLKNYPEKELVKEPAKQEQPWPSKPPIEVF